MSRYVPLDVILEQPATRLLRALRWFDWVNSSDVINAAGFPEQIAGQPNRERDTASQALYRLSVAGLVERSGVRGDGFLYRITAHGRARLATLLEGVSFVSERNMRRARRAA